MARFSPACLNQLAGTVIADLHDHLLLRGAAAAYRAGSHIAITMLVDHINPAMKKALAVFVDLAMLATCLFIIHWGLSVVWMPGRTWCHRCRS
ncbi:hypothetical protein CEW81_03660 [Kluyvera genomosp. 3]|uniref:TRAP transporter small permease protein n=1 Tax=Kluyvera genomosp. 3 TaxID=2774055 RepID=A0A248KGQ2_9ENTR|nr:hypothetical protein CEW81_03660 [Kluyvera genomosp. 3]